MTNPTNGPESDGTCALAVSLGSQGVEGSPKHAVTNDRRTFYFKNGVAKMLWNVLPGRRGKADAAWASR